MDPTPITSYDDDFESHSGSEVQAFLKDRLKTHEDSIDDLKTLGSDFTPAEDGSSGTLSIRDRKGNILTSCDLPLGSGGSTEGIAVTRLEVSVDNPTVRLGGDVMLSYSYDNIISGGPNNGDSTGASADLEIEIIGSSTASIYKRSIRNVSPGTYTLAIGKYLQSGDNSVYVRATVTDADGNTKTRQAYAKVSALDISLACTFNPTPMCADGGYAEGVAIPVPFEVAGSGNKQVMLYVDGTLQQTKAVPRSGRTVGSFSVAGLTPGLHNLQLVAELEQDGITVRSSSHYIDIYVKDATAAPAAWIALKMENADGTVLPAAANAWKVPVDTIEQRTTVDISFTAYDPAALKATVQLRQGADTLQTVTVPRSLQTISQRFLDPGTVNLSLCVADCIRALKLNVLPSDILVSVAQLSLAYSHEDAFTLTNGQQRELPLTPFATDPRQQGMTLEVTFTVSDVIDRSATVLDCTETLPDGLIKGFRITGDEIAYYTGEQVSYTNEDGLPATRDIKLSTQYSASARPIKAAFVVRPNVTGAGDRLMELFVDGCRVGADIYSPTFSFGQSAPVPLSFHSSGANVTVHSVRQWTRDLSDDECLDNTMADTIDLDELRRLFEDNDIMDASGSEPDIARLIAGGKGVIRIVRTGLLDDVYATNDKKKDFPADVHFSSPYGDGHSFILRGCYIRIQGTSSTKYPSKNIRIYFTKGVNVGMVVGGKVVKSWPIRPGATEVTVICLKSDYSDSSMSLNTGSAKLFNDVSKELGVLTPPQQWQADHGQDITVRSAIDGYPIDVFVSETEDSAAVYMGQYNLNNEKSKSGRVFGMEGVEGFEPECPLALEFLNNSSKVCLFDTASDEELGELFDSGAEVNYGIDADGNVCQDGDCAWTPNPDKKVTGMSPAAKEAVTGLWSWLRSCKPAGADPADINTYVSARFRSEAAEHLSIDNLCFYYLKTDYFASVDQRVKNMIARTWDGKRWYLTWYDGDTQLGKRNDSFLKYLYTTTRDTWDGEMSKYAFEGHDSLLWNLVLANFMPELRAMAQRLRDRLTLGRMLDMFNNEQAGNWCTRLYNKSSELKYITPAIRETYGKTWPFIYALQGANTPHRTYFLTNRCALLDAKWGVSSAHDDNIDLYLSRSASDIPERVRITASEDYIFGYGTNNSPDIFTTPGIIPGGTDVEIAIAEAYTINDPLRIYGASRTRRLDMRAACAHLKNGLDLSRCSALQELDLSVPAGSSPSESWFMVLNGCRALSKINLNGQKGARTSSGSAVLDLSSQPRLRTLDARGVNTSAVVFASGAPLSSVMLPESITTLTLDGHSTLTSAGLSIPASARLSSISIKGCPALDSRAIVEKAIADGSLRELTLEDIDWTDVSLATLEALATLSGSVTGTITVSTAETVDYATKFRLIGKFGDIDSETAPLRIIYRALPLGSRTLKITGPKEMPAPGDYRLALSPSAFNDCVSMVWEMPANSYANIAQDGTVTVTKRGTVDEAPEITVTCRVLMSSGEELTVTRVICFYERTPQIGDIVYADGSCSDEWDDEKTAVGVCAFVGTDPLGSPVRVCVRKYQAPETSVPWGIHPTDFPDMKLESDPTYNVYHVNAFNKPYTGFSVLTEDYTTPWRVIPAGTVVHNAWLRTQEIVAHRDKILTDLGLPLPYNPETRLGEQQLLNDLYNQLVLSNGYEAKYKQYYYPAASYIAHFQPLVKAGEVLSDRFLIGMWFGAGVRDSGMEGDAAGNDVYGGPLYALARSKGLLNTKNYFHSNTIEEVSELNTAGYSGIGAYQTAKRVNHTVNMFCLF